VKARKRQNWLKNLKDDPIDWSDFDYWKNIQKPNPAQKPKPKKPGKDK
jgi:hypothetical protein